MGVNDQQGIYFQGEAIKTATVEQEQVRRGNVFTCDRVYRNLASAGVLNIVFDPTNFTGDRIRAIVPQITSKSGPVLWQLYANINYTASTGTLCSSFNRNSNSLNTPKSEIRINPDGITGDTSVNLFSEKLLFGASQGNVTTSGTVIPELPFALNKNIIYLLRLTNEDDVATDIDYTVSWFDVDLG